MTSLRSMKARLYGISRALGFTGFLRDSGWRSMRLLILGYHGISFDDEHQWNPALYISADQFRQRLAMIHNLKCNVLPLGEGLERLFAGTLPPRSVVITFDDGSADFFFRAHPVIREFGFPVTVYWTTYYATFQRPVPDTTVPYLLWKARGQRLEWPDVLPVAIELDGPGRVRARALLRAYMEQHKLDARQKDDLLAELSGRLGIDYAEFCNRRLLQIMRADEASALVRAGVDLQIHTHRHRTPDDPDLLLRELAQNRELIMTSGAPNPCHFCYPNGRYLCLDRDRLSQGGIVSAVTCDPGLATRQSDPLGLPRFVDTCSCSSLEFEAWLSGVPQLLPRRRARQSGL